LTAGLDGTAADGLLTSSFGFFMKTAIFIPAYQAEKTIERVVRGIPLGVYTSIDKVYVQDDASTDKTYDAALRLCREYDKLQVVRNPVNLGYGGTKKKAYGVLLAEAFDIIVMMHGDGQHCPRALPGLLSPVETGTADIVLGSRILGAPLRGGMPIYKLAGNRLLTAMLNFELGLRLTDYHTGYRCYSASALRAVKYGTCSDGHLISAELLVRGARLGLRIKEVPVSTSYGPDSRSMSCYASIRYGLSVVALLAAGRRWEITRTARGSQSG
jgi:glycosyltransferase involved in cell wall biosynthesis